MDATTQARFRKVVAAYTWRKAMLPQYWTCPHEYIVRKRECFKPWAPWACSERDFQFLARTIAKYGERKKWRSRRDVVLFDGRYVYFRIQGLINRTYKESHDNDGYPAERALAQMRKRFWPTTEERHRYKFLSQQSTKEHVTMEVR